MAKKKTNITDIQKDIKEAIQIKQQNHDEGLEAELEKIAKAFKTKVIKEKRPKGFVCYKIKIEGKEITVGGKDNYQTEKTILIIDTIRTYLIYNGVFTEPAEHYIRILKRYLDDSRTIRTGYKQRH